MRILPFIPVDTENSVRGKPQLGLMKLEEPKHVPASCSPTQLQAPLPPCFLSFGSQHSPAQVGPKQVAVYVLYLRGRERRPSWGRRCYLVGYDKLEENLVTSWSFHRKLLTIPGEQLTCLPKVDTHIPPIF